ncbi:MAG: formate dehydrogenase accessory sulfurtransferase FdhD [Acidimicrobiales bacterium]|nr:formate dehydrogenase accessory sulfurtransferase FdhD [Acidimicrobiales bacterium]MDP6900391.1 formate dehydrogenase accessory sulfurtransferase FdhD [Acidimicrobiales bacterium]
MRRGRTEKFIIQRIHSGAVSRLPDEVVVEEPLEIRLDGNLVATTMRTPGHDYELAVGFCAAENLLEDVSVTGVRYCGEGPAADYEYNVVTVETGGQAPVPKPRLGNVSSSCGLCGSVALTELATRMTPINEAITFDVQALNRMLKEVQAQQEMFSRTGGLHAAAVFGADGAIELVREDIGRHNAVDKVIGNRFLQEKFDAKQLGLFVSGRASFEMVQKAWAGGFGTLIAVSAPSALAVELAKRANMTLIGFAREDSMNIYTGEIDQ